MLLRTCHTFKRYRMTRRKRFRKIYFKAHEQCGERDLGARELLCLVTCHMPHLTGTTTVAHSIANGEVDSSILTGGTIPLNINSLLKGLRFLCRHRPWSVASMGPRMACRRLVQEYKTPIGISLTTADRVAAKAKCPEVTADVE
jgi:hypothetical protein